MDADDGMMPRRMEVLYNVFAENETLQMAGHRRAPSRSSSSSSDVVAAHETKPLNITWGVDLNERRKRTGWAFGRGGICATGHITVRAELFESRNSENSVDKNSVDNGGEEDANHQDIQVEDPAADGILEDPAYSYKNYARQFQ